MRGVPGRLRGVEISAAPASLIAAAGILAAGLFLVRPAAAHPAVSLVVDSRGNVYFSDLQNVRVLRPDGTIEVAIAGVHTHELWLGPGDVLYGEDVTNVGDDYRHRVWRREPDGSLHDVIPWREGYPDDFHDYGFARDAAGNSYVLRRAERSIEVRDTSSQLLRTVDLSPHAGFPHWLTVEPGGRVHAAVGSGLLRIDPGAAQAEVVATDLVERTGEFDWVHDRHALMGLWTDAAGTVYVSVYAGQVVKRVTDTGEVQIVARSSAGWSPVGGRIAPDGSVWLLEWSGSNQVRVRRIGADGAERIFEID